MKASGFFWIDGIRTGLKQEVEIIKEYPRFYLVRRTTETGSYTLAINKADLICGDVEIKK